MASVNVAAYGEGELGPTTLSNNLDYLRQSGWTSIMVSLFHIDQAGDIHFNNTPVFVGGAYQLGDTDWVSQLSSLLTSGQGTVENLLASFGGGGVGDFTNVQTIYDDNSNSFSGTNLEANFAAFAATFSGVITIIDIDAEDNYDESSLVALCQMLIGQGFNITFCPYANQNFWVSCLSQLESSNSGSVVWWNLQQYSGGIGNDPASWASAITSSLPTFNTDGFILASQSARSATGYGSDPSQVQSFLAGLANESCVGGAFIWTLDTILKNAMPNYVAAIQNGLAANAGGASSPGTTAPAA